MYLSSVLCFFFDGSHSKVIALPTLSLFLAMKGDSEKITVTSLTPLRAKKSDNYCNSWKSDNYMGSNTEKKPWTNLQNSYKYWSKEIKSNSFCYRKVRRAITKWGSIEKSPILRSQYWKNYHFLKGNKINSHFDGSNNIFANYRFGMSECPLVTRTKVFTPGSVGKIINNTKV